MTHTTSSSAIEFIEERIAPLRNRLAKHPLYAAISTQNHIRTFMEWHVFAVWDFMSLLKALQRNITCVSAPWVPTSWPESRRFINEIVFGEESDRFDGRAVSHFELYIEAMQECGANTAPIRRLLAEISQSPSNCAISDLLEAAQVPQGASRFVRSTFDVIHSGNTSAMAAAFTFGREDLIPDMFRQLVRDLDESGAALRKFIWYLERHIAVDSDDHGPLSLRMVIDLCRNEERRWEEAAAAAEAAISARLALWDGILEALTTGARS